MRLDRTLSGICLALALIAAPALGQSRSVRIAFIAKSYANPVFLAAHNGAQAAARELSLGGVPIQVEILTPSREDPAAQAAQV